MTVYNHGVCTSCGKGVRQADQDGFGRCPDCVALQAVYCEECERELTPEEIADNDKHCPDCQRELARIARLEEGRDRDHYGDDDTDPDGSGARWEMQREQMREGGLLDDRERIGYVSARQVARNLAERDETDDEQEHDETAEGQCEKCLGWFDNDGLSVCCVCDGVYCDAHMTGDRCVDCVADDEMVPEAV